MHPPVTVLHDTTGGRAVTSDALESLRAAVAAAPADLQLRLLLASRLLQAERSAEALAEAATVLAADPASIEALRIAADAAAASGAPDRAVGYRRLLAALGAGNAEAPLTIESLEAAPALDIDAPVTAPADADADADDDAYDEFERPSITLADVGGLEQVKRRLQTTFLGPLRNPEMREAFGATMRGGLLLWGPPGCGKTFLARALAGELRAAFLPVGITDVLDPYMGVAEHNLHAQFETARRLAPAVLFLDEIDALGQKRSHLRGSAARSLVNQLLTEMDGIDARNDGIFILGATNHPWDVDTALRRAGRFDRSLLVLPPDEPAREAIFRFHLASKPGAAELDVRQFAKSTDGYSGADIALICRSATENALERSMANGALSPITSRDVARAIKDVRPSTTAWLEAARNYALYANDSGDYDELAVHLRQRKLL